MTIEQTIQQMAGKDDWGRYSLDNEEAILRNYWRPDVTKRMWIATGTLDADGGKTEVEIHPEHRRVIVASGYTITWDIAGEITGDTVPVRLAEANNGRRRVAAVLKLGTEDEWIQVNRKYKL